jgi:hypothetical protein
MFAMARSAALLSRPAPVVGVSASSMSGLRGPPAVAGGPAVAAAAEPDRERGLTGSFDDAGALEPDGATEAGGGGPWYVLAARGAAVVEVDVVVDRGSGGRLIVVVVVRRTEVVVVGFAVVVGPGPTGGGAAVVVGRAVVVGLAVVVGSGAVVDGVVSAVEVVTQPSGGQDVSPLAPGAAAARRRVRAVSSSTRPAVNRCRWDRPVIGIVSSRIFA